MLDHLTQLRCLRRDLPGLSPEAEAALDEAEAALRALNPCRCPVPPPGWACTREPGHDGPCAAVPVDWAVPPAGAVVFAWYDVFNGEFTRDPLQALRAIEGGNSVLPLWADVRRARAIDAASAQHGRPGDGAEAFAYGVSSVTLEQPEERARNRFFSGLVASLGLPVKKGGRDDA